LVYLYVPKQNFENLIENFIQAIGARSSAFPLRPFDKIYRDLMIDQPLFFTELFCDTCLLRAAVPAQSQSLLDVYSWILIVLSLL